MKIQVLADFLSTYTYATYHWNLAVFSYLGTTTGQYPVLVMVKCKTLRMITTRERPATFVTMLSIDNAGICAIYLTGLPLKSTSY